MGLLSFLKRKSGPITAKAPAYPESADSVQQARTRARQRLVGSVVLVTAGVIGFPLLFETQPRPLPVDTPIEIVRKDGGTAAPASAPKRPASLPPALPPAVSEQPPEPVREAEARPAAASAPVVAAASAPADRPSAAVAEARPAAKPASKPEAKPSPAPPDSARAQALLDGKETAHKPAAAEGRFIVQVGAFAEAAAAREARQKVEKLGLKTYTQVVETSGGKRIRVRVGPFGSRDEADKVVNKIKSAGLSSAVYTL